MYIYIYIHAEGVVQGGRYLPSFYGSTICASHEASTTPGQLPKVLGELAVQGLEARRSRY